MKSIDVHGRFSSTIQSFLHSLPLHAVPKTITNRVGRRPLFLFLPCACPCATRVLTSLSSGGLSPSSWPYTCSMPNVSSFSTSNFSNQYASCFLFVVFTALFCFSLSSLYYVRSSLPFAHVYKVSTPVYVLSSHSFTRSCSTCHIHTCFLAERFYFFSNSKTGMQIYLKIPL